jgi:hypothetical protein
MIGGSGRIEKAKPPVDPLDVGASLRILKLGRLGAEEPDQRFRSGVSRSPTGSPLSGCAGVPRGTRARPFRLLTTSVADRFFLGGIEELLERRALPNVPLG